MIAAAVSLQVARGLARRVRGSHVAEMAATLGVDLRPVAQEVADGGTEDFETLQAQLQDACKDAIDAYMAQQGDEGQHAPKCNSLHTRVASTECWLVAQSALQCFVVKLTIDTAHHASDSCRHTPRETCGINGSVCPPRCGCD